MCLAVPGKILTITETPGEPRMAEVDFGGIRRSICVAWIDRPVCGEYILAHAGVALCKIDTQEALDTLNDFDIIADHIARNHESDPRF